MRGQQWIRTCGTLIQKLESVHSGGGIPVSIEILPCNSQEETRHLLASIDNIYESCNIQFCAVTWHLRNFSTSYGMNLEALQLANDLRIRNKEVLLHVAAKGLFKENILQILQKLQSFNVNNIFAVRGDNVENTLQDFQYAGHMVKFIRQYAPHDMVICVAGYPKGHPEAQSYRKDLYYLREKVNAGANFIISQIILEGEEFNSFVKDCRDIGIQVPILAGIMPIQNYCSFQRMSEICHLQIPQHVETTLQSIKDNPESVKNFGIFHAVTIIRTILSKGNPQGLHFFTMNRTSTVQEILKQVGLAVSSPANPLPILPKEDDNHVQKRLNSK